MQSSVTIRSAVSAVSVIVPAKPIFTDDTPQGIGGAMSAPVARDSAFGECDGDEQICCERQMGAVVLDGPKRQENAIIMLKILTYIDWGLIAEIAWCCGYFHRVTPRRLVDPYLVQLRRDWMLGGGRVPNDQPSVSLEGWLDV